MVLYFTYFFYVFFQIFKVFYGLRLNDFFKKRKRLRPCLATQALGPVELSDWRHQRQEKSEKFLITVTTNDQLYVYSITARPTRTEALRQFYHLKTFTITTSSNQASLLRHLPTLTRAGLTTLLNKPDSPSTTTIAKLHQLEVA